MASVSKDRSTEAQESPADWEIQKYANSQGVTDSGVVSKIRVDFEQISLPGFKVSYRDKRFARKNLSAVNGIRAEALRNLHSPDRVAEAFKEGDVISSILPEHIKGNIPAFNIVGAVIETPEDFAKLTWTLRTPYMEVLKVAFLDQKGKIEHSATLSVGAINMTLMHPQMVLRELQRIAGKVKATRVILSHNHPSGDPAPSQDDIRSTRVLEKGLKIAGIELVDHVVTNGKKFASWKNGWAVRPLETPQPEWEVVSRSDLPKITGYDELEKVVASLRQADPEHDHVIYGNVKLQVTAVERLSSSLSIGELALRIARGSGREGAIHVWFESVQRELRDIKRLHKSLEDIQVQLLDAGISGKPSLKALGLLETTPALESLNVSLAEPQENVLQLSEAPGNSSSPGRSEIQIEFLFDLSPVEAKDIEDKVSARCPLADRADRKFNFSTETNHDLGRSKTGSGLDGGEGDERREDRGNRQTLPGAGGRLAGKDERDGMENEERGDQVRPSPRPASDPLRQESSWEGGLDFEKGKRPNDTRLNASKPVELTPLRRVEINLRAMEIVAHRRKENDFSPLRPGQREVLRQYTGWGGIANQFLDPRKPENEERLKQIQELIGPEGLAAITAGVKNAHYTSYQVVKFGWDAAQKLGFRGGHVLEPAAGVGNMIGLCPRDLPTQFLAVELDPLSADITRLLYPDSQVIHSAFERVEGYRDHFDLAFTNVPFGDYKPKCPVSDPHRALKPLIHDYFILRQLDMVRPGGLCMVITGKGTMDKATDKIRELIASKADLVAAFRLPESAFKDNADTLVTTDMLILRKREEGQWPGGEKFSRVVPDPVSGLRINEYFARHPGNMFGRMAEGGMMARSQGKLTGVEAEDLPSYFAAALDRLKPLNLPEPFTGSQEIGVKLLPCSETLRIGEVLDQNNRFYSVVAQGGMIELAVPGESIRELRSALLIKDKLRELLSAQLESASDEGLSVLQTDLRRLVSGHLEKFCEIQGMEDAKHSPLDTPTLRDLMEADPDYFKIISLVDRGIRYSDIFSTRTVFSMAYQPQPPGPEASLEDITLYVRQHHGSVDVAKIAELKGMPEADARNTLLRDGLVFVDPVNGRMVHRIEYLAGDDVYAKLDAARAAASKDPVTFQRNVEELEKIIPSKIPLEELSINSRQLIYDPALLQSFLCDQLQGEFTIKRFLTGKIEVEGGSQEDSAQGNANGSYSKAFEAYANRETVRIRGDRSKEEEMTPEEYQELQARRQAQREFEAKTSRDFESWVKDHGDKPIPVAGNPPSQGDSAPKEETVREYVERVYNRSFNRSVSPVHDGSRLRFQGIAGEMNGEPLFVHKHNLDFAARMLFEGRGGNAHCVGAGKTFAGSLAAKAWKQSGMVRKPAFIVPKKVLRKWAKEYSALFPGDNIMVIDQFDKANREEMLSRIAVSSPDAIFMTHEHAKMIPNDPKVEARLIEEELATLRDQLFEAQAKDVPKRTIRSIENSIAKFDARLSDLRQFAQTNRITFIETGIDALIVDEAHNYKNLPVQTKEQASGIPSGSSQRSFDLYMKTRQVLEAHDNRGVLLLTATPISNTMAEIYNMVKFLAPEAWKSRGIRSFDNWIDMFGEIATKPQVLVDGSFGIRSSLSSFKNLPELKQIFENLWEARTAEQLQLKRPVPELSVRVVEPSPEQARYFQEIVNRAEDIRNKEVEPWQDNMLKLTVDGRKAALDMRLVDLAAYREFGEYPDSKLNVMADEIWSRYEDAREWGIMAGQLVFFDLYSAEALAEVEAIEEKNNKGAENEVDEEEEAPAGPPEESSKTLTEETEIQHGGLAMANRPEHVHPVLEGLPGDVIPIKDGVIYILGDFQKRKDANTVAASLPSGMGAVEGWLNKKGKARGWTVLIQNPSEKLRCQLDEIRDKWGTLAYYAGQSPSRVEGEKKESKLEGDQAVAAKPQRLDLHTELAKELMKRGVPPEEIAILNGKQNATALAKQLVSDRYNEGKLRVVIGTTPAMGEGMNLQRITTAIHHADVPLKPSHMEQRDGRGLRQGNVHSNIEILRYATRGSFDQYLYQLLERKARFITAFMSERKVERVVDGVSDAVVLSYEEAMGATARDPRIREYFVNKVKLSQAEVALKGAEQEWRTLKFHVKEIESTIKRCETNLERGEKRLEMRNAVLKELLGEAFDPKKLPESLPLRLRMGDKTILDEKAIAVTLDGILEKQLTGGKEDARWIIGVRKEIPGSLLEINGIRFEERLIRGVELSMFSKDARALVRQGDVIPIPVMELRSPATQLMGNVRYEMRSVERTLELAREERGKLEAAKRSCDRRLETAGKNFEAAQKTCCELAGRVAMLAKEVGVDGKGVPSPNQDEGEKTPSASTKMTSPVRRLKAKPVEQEVEIEQ